MKGFCCGVCTDLFEGVYANAADNGNDAPRSKAPVPIKLFIRFTIVLLMEVVCKGRTKGNFCAFTIWGSQENNDENSNGDEGSYRIRSASSHHYHAIGI
jgi:hypothetical protein